MSSFITTKSTLDKVGVFDPLLIKIYKDYKEKTLNQKELLLVNEYKNHKNFKHIPIKSYNKLLTNSINAYIADYAKKLVKEDIKSLQNRINLLNRLL